MDVIYIVRNFLAAIINRAITDWFNYDELRDEIREFFASEWGEEVGEILDLSAKDILRRLESGKINYQALDGEAE